MSRPQTVTAAGVFLLVVGGNLALGGGALAVLLFREPASPCLCFTCPFSVCVLALGLALLRFGWLVLNGQLETVSFGAAVVVVVGALLAFSGGVLLSKELPRFVRADRPRTVQYTLEVGAVALTFADGIALAVAGALLAVARHRYVEWQRKFPPPPDDSDSDGQPLPTDRPRP